jgi:hypothetical protein
MSTKPIAATVIAAAKTLWGYHCIYDAPAPADAIVGLGSYDLRVADRCTALFADGYGASSTRTTFRAGSLAAAEFKLLL